MSPDEIAEKFNISDTLAQSIEPCCGILFHILKVAETDKIIIPFVTTREAIIKDFFRELKKSEDPFVSDMIECVKTLGNRYHFDVNHAETVTEKHC